MSSEASGAVTETERDTAPPVDAELRPIEPGQRRGTLAFVPARYGPEVIGGAEIVLARMAAGLRDRGWDIEILTTCALDHFAWENVLPPGDTVEDGVTVRRFPTVVSTAGAERAAIEAAILRGEPVTQSQQYRWINDGMRVPGLYHHLLDRAGDYRAIVLGPYPFWPAFACSQVSPERSVLWACLHDEPYAYLDIFQPVLSGSAGLLLQSPPEHDLAHRLVPRLASHALTGCGVEVPSDYDPDGFRKRFEIPDGPYLLYAGRREGAKGWEELLSTFAAALRLRGLPFSLVTMGAGPVRPPADIADRVVDVGFLPDHERDNAFAGAAAYLQPSRYEAFSRTIMEAWLAGTPVIGNAASAVVGYHCERSGAGLVYDDAYELEEALAFVAEAPETAQTLGAAGRRYVLENFQWADVLDRVEAALVAWTREP